MTKFEKMETETTSFLQNAMNRMFPRSNGLIKKEGVDNVYVKEIVHKKTSEEVENSKITRSELRWLKKSIRSRKYKNLKMRTFKKPVYFKGSNRKIQKWLASRRIMSLIENETKNTFENIYSNWESYIQCQICSCSNFEKVDVIRIVPCGHWCCKGCFGDGFKDNNCPFCRTKITSTLQKDFVLEDLMTIMNHKFKELSLFPSKEFFAKWFARVYLDDLTTSFIRSSINTQRISESKIKEKMEEELNKLDKSRQERDSIKLEIARLNERRNGLIKDCDKWESKCRDYSTKMNAIYNDHVKDVDTEHERRMKLLEKRKIQLSIDHRTELDKINDEIKRSKAEINAAILSKNNMIIKQKEELKVKLEMLEDDFIKTKNQHNIDKKELETKIDNIIEVINKNGPFNIPKIIGSFVSNFAISVTFLNGEKSLILPIGKKSLSYFVFRYGKDVTKYIKNQNPINVHKDISKKEFMEDYYIFINSLDDDSSLSTIVEELKPTSPYTFNGTKHTMYNHK